MYIEELKKILHEGFLLKTKIDENENWQYNIIYSIYNDMLVINLKNTIETASDLIGHNINLKIGCTEFEYISTGLILDINRNSCPVTAKIRLISAERYINKRRYERYLTNMGCNIKASGESIGTFSLASNISFTGGYIETNIDLSIDLDIKLDILTENNLILPLNGKVIRKDILNDKFGYGIVFKNNAEDKIKSLEDILHILEDFEFSILSVWQHQKYNLPDKNDSELKVLIVDDIKFTRIYLKNILETQGFRDIIEASNGNEAIQKAVIFNPDIITLDISMPGIDGIEALKHIKNSNCKAKVVVISAFIDEQTKEILTQLGVNYFITKPFEQLQVTETIKKIYEEDIK